MRPFYWSPTPDERRQVIAQILDGVVTQSELDVLLAALPTAPIALFSDLRVSLVALAVRAEIPKLAQSLSSWIRGADSVRAQIEDHVRTRQPSIGQVVEHAQALWEERRVATASHLEQ